MLLMSCFIISFISFVSCIIATYITVLLYDVRTSHLNKDYLLTYLLTDGVSSIAYSSQ